MTMDARDQFPVDMVEQMLKFTPSPEERVSIKCWACWCRVTSVVGVCTITNSFLSDTGWFF